MNTCRPSTVADVTVAEIEHAARRRWRVADASVASYAERQIGKLCDVRREGFGSFDNGVWYVLSIRRDAGSGWEVIARRRTLAALLAVVESRATAMVAL